MTATAQAAGTLTAVYVRPTRRRKWRLLGVFETRQEAWEAVGRLPQRTVHLWLADVPRPPTERDRPRPPDPTG
jgi:hypothetical protein